MVIQELWIYVRERYPLQASLPLAAVLSLGALGRAPPLAFVTTTASLFLLFFVARAMDDLADRERDAIHSPRRALVTGRVKPKSICAGCFVAALAQIIVNMDCRAALALSFGLTLYYFSFLKIRRYFPLFAKTAFFNVAFVAVPLLGDAHAGRPLQTHSLLLGLFLWFSAMGHEFTHSCAEAPVPEGTSFATYTNFLRPRQIATLGCFFFLLGIGCLAVDASTVPALSHTLIVWLAAVGVFSAAILVQPSAKMARATYIPGFLFILVPLFRIFSE